MKIIKEDGEGPVAVNHTGTATSTDAATAAQLKQSILTRVLKRIKLK